MATAIATLAPRSILDFGCGEAFLVDRLLERGATLDGYVGVDLRADALDEARARLPAFEFVATDVLFWTPAQRFDLVLASQVLEHLHEPEHYLARLRNLCSGRMLLTVPLEPWFRLLNLARGRDVLRLGNHPEHVNHWSLESFSAFVGARAAVIRAWTVFPFVFLLAQP